MGMGDITNKRLKLNFAEYHIPLIEIKEEKQNLLMLLLARLRLSHVRDYNCLFVTLVV